MRDVLCIYYSRTGNTKRVMETIAKEMDAELLALTDGVERSGLRGWPQRHGRHAKGLP